MRYKLLVLEASFLSDFKCSSINSINKQCCCINLVLPVILPEPESIVNQHLLQHQCVMGGTAGLLDDNVVEVGPCTFC